MSSFVFRFSAEHISKLLSSHYCFHYKGHKRVSLLVRVCAFIWVFLTNEDSDTFLVPESFTSRF